MTDQEPTFFTGSRHPKDVLNTYGDRRFGTKEQHAFADRLKNASDGSVYLDKTTDPGARYTINFNGKMTTVSHIKVDGTWELYHKGEPTNLVIKVRVGDDPWAVHHILERALYSTKLGHALSYDAMRPLTDAIMEVLGLDDIDDWTSSDTYAALKGSGASEDLVQTKLRAVMEWAPERGYDTRLGKIFADADGVGYAKNGPEYAKYINGDSDGWGEKGKGKPLALLSEPVFYGLAGSKDGGRSFRSRLLELMEAVGLDYWSE